jgi:hypothetical protein
VLYRQIRNVEARHGKEHLIYAKTALKTVIPIKLT